MIHTDEAVFIHVPKTGGMSVTSFLINALDIPVTVFAFARAEAHTRKQTETPFAAGKLRFVAGRRHAPCDVAARDVAAAGLAMPPLAFSVVREPVSLMVSYYKYMRTPKVWKQRGMEPDSLTGAPKLAMEEDFEGFLRKVDFYGMTDDQIADYYRPHGFARLDIVALEHLGPYLEHRFGHHRAFDIAELKQRNTSRGAGIEVEVTPEARAVIAAKYPRMAETHARALERPWAAG
jgi:hypothetical protein